MARMTMQIHVTKEDFFTFISEMAQKDFCIKGIKTDPDFEIFSIGKDFSLKQMENMERVFISKKEIEEAQSCRTFMQNTLNTIGIEFGIEKQDSLSESRMWIVSEGEIDPELKRIYTNFRKNMIKGAWVICPDPNVGKRYKKNHYYTMNARKANKSGMKMFAFAGCSYYDLDMDSDK